MARKAEVEITDNDGYVVRIWAEYDDDGDRISKEIVEVFTDVDGVAEFLKKELKSNAGARR